MRANHHPLLAACVLVVAIATAGRLPAATLSVGEAANFTDQQVVAATSQLAEITGLAWAPDGGNRLFVTRKSGQVRIVKDGALLATPFVDFTQAPNTLWTGSECGVIGLCFDPDFASNHYVYFFVTVSNSEQRIYRYNASADVASDRTQLIAGLPTHGNNHDGGGIAFGPDGKLYWAVGNLGNGSANHGEGTTATNLLSSKVGRANRDGSPVAGNPWYDGGAVGNNDYVFAQGFRNPFTLTFQPATGLLWVNVVGDGWEQVFQVAAGDYVGDRQNENIQGAGMKAPVIAYATGGSPTIDITAASRSGNVTTFTTATAHRLRLGGRVAVTGMGDATFNGAALFVASVPSATTFTVSQTGANGTSPVSSASDLVPADFGNCVSGGAFLDTTGVSAAYRGDFIFGDYGSGNVMRARMSGATVLSVDTFATGSGGQIDVAVGPDGAIYYAGYNGGTGAIRRFAFNHGTTQSLVVTPLTLTLNEGNQATSSVRLAVAPTGPVTVAAAVAGSSDVTVASGSSLTFTTGNWNVPQAVTINAAVDGDSSDDAATVTLSSGGLTAVPVAVTVLDSSQEIVPSTATLTVTEAGSNTFSVRLSRAPAATVTVGVARSAGSSDITVGSSATLTFTTANWATPQTVTINAAADGDTTNDTATIALTATGLATRSVTVTATDTSAAAPVITSTADTTAVVGAPYSYDVDASGTPAPTYSLTANPAGMTINGTTGVISWTPGPVASANVTVQAANGVLPNATQSFTITVAADQPPTATLTQPTAGATVSGATAEFYGDGADDVGCVRAEFFVDGTLIYTDNASGHFHVGGAHQRWDTTALINGPHTLRMRVFDSAGNSDDVEVTVTVDNAGGGGGGPGAGAGSSGSSCGLGALVASLLLAFTLGLWRLRLR